MDLCDTLRAAAEKRLAFIRANEEKLVEAWLAETGLLPSESVIEVQNYHDGRTVIRVTATVAPRNFSRRLIDSLMAERNEYRSRVQRALEAAGGRWSEWGDRALAVADILEGGHV